MKSGCCRISKKELSPIFDLGNLYVTGFYPEITLDAPRGHLQLGIGEESGLAQLCHSIDRDVLYREYWYRSGTNETMTRQLKEVVDQIPYWVKLNKDDVVLDIGCNDGTLLKHYPKSPKLFKVGLDPAKNIAEEGRAFCDAHAAEYFTKENFFKLSDEKKAKVITAIAMFYDLEDPSSFVKDIVDSLTDDGIFIVQLSYTPLMIKQNAFDNMIHEHLQFYTLASLTYLFDKYDLKIVDVQLNDVNAGSFRVISTKRNNSLDASAIFTKDIGQYRINSFLLNEIKCGMGELDTFKNFIKQVDKEKKTLMDLLCKLRNQGKKVYGYGASSKGNTLLQYYGITPDLVTAIAERQPQKYGLLAAGSWIPIISEEEMRAAKPDYLLILPWHFIHEFVYREKDFLSKGGKFITPLPEVKIFGA